ncbi:MAG TPA: 6,7-dimethyl-8-ribityllumazine synthase [Gemmatimonadaceae bacterium]|jgi:6,7-dimethyl-8-ribityllumazine synthase
MAELSGAPSGAGRRIAVVASRFNEDITRALVDGALDALVKHGASFDDIDILWVPGAWELPLAVRRAMETERYDAIVAVGAVIRGETPHFDYIAAEASRGLADAARDSEIPVGFGLLTCNDIDQARARSGGAHGNKGWDAAIAALEMADLMQQLDLGDET